jgi:hypothetical protein
MVARRTRCDRRSLAPYSCIVFRGRDRFGRPFRLEAERHWRIPGPGYTGSVNGMSPKDSELRCLRENKSTLALARKVGFFPRSITTQSIEFEFSL